MRNLWTDNPTELQWRENLKVNDIVDHEKWNKKWCIGQVVADHHDPLLILVVPNQLSIRQSEWFCRYAIFFFFETKRMVGTIR